jgi:hypothetical protein
MKEWSERIPEVAYLLNPAFCGAVLYNAVFAYEKKAKENFPFALVYLVLPLVLHSDTCKKIDSRSYLVTWVKNNPELFVDFPQRARSLVTITNEALEFLLRTRSILISNTGRIGVLKDIETPARDDTTYIYLNKAQHLGRMFQEAGNVELIYISLGVRP